MVVNDDAGSLARRVTLRFIASKLAPTLASAVSDAPFAQVIGRQLDAHFVTGKNTNVVLAHLAGNMRGYDVPISKLSSFDMQ
jgi:hypothetical protein